MSHAINELRIILANFKTNTIRVTQNILSNSIFSWYRLALLSNSLQHRHLVLPLIIYWLIQAIIVALLRLFLVTGFLIPLTGNLHMKPTLQISPKPDLYGFRAHGIECSELVHICACWSNEPGLPNSKSILIYMLCDLKTK